MDLRKTRNDNNASITRRPNAQIAELYGYSPSSYLDANLRSSIARQCPIRNSICDVTANRNDRAYLNLSGINVSQQDKTDINAIYGSDPLPLGICSCWTKRQNENEAKPWILCPKRLLTLEPPKPIIPKEVQDLIQIPQGMRVGVWPELKLRIRDSESSNDIEASSRFFEYTFDYLLMQLDPSGKPIGSPYIIEVMTSSTRGGGLTEHMVDVLQGRPQRYLGGGLVKSVYTPNYRQVFERMLGQFIVKSEIAERWGGRAIWVLQDVLLDYIEQTTAFDSRKILTSDSPNVFVEAYKLKEGASTEPSASGLQLTHHKSLRGRARLEEHSEDFTSFLGLGYAPSLNELISTLSGFTTPSLNKRNQPEHVTRRFDFMWGEEIDPRDTEPSTR